MMVSCVDTAMKSIEPVVTVFHSPEATRSSVERETVKKLGAIERSLGERPIAGVRVEAPPAASRTDLELVHSPAYVEAVLTGEPEDLAQSSGVGRWDEGLARSVLHTTGAVIEACERAMKTGRPCCALAAGLHHAKFASGDGFCTVNGLVIGARRALAMGKSRVLIIDLDAHCGGGTASLIADIPGVEQVDVSVIPYDTYPSSAKSRLEVLTGIENGAEYLVVLRRALASVSDPQEIDLVVYNAGVDVAGMAGGIRAVDAEVVRARDRLVFEWTKAHGIPTAWVLAGGYTVDCTMDELVDLHRIAMEEAVSTWS